MSFKIVVPTRDGGRWLAPFLRAYRNLHVEPLYIVDSRSSDDSISLLKEMDADFRVFDGHADYAEGGAVEFASACMPDNCAWTLRIDDDEFPSKALLDWVAGDHKEAEIAWAISRRDIMRDGAALAYSRYWSHYHWLEMPEYLNPQARLYKHAQVKFCDLIHSTGIHQEKFGLPPQDKYFMHFDVLLRDANERIEKLRRYESARRGSSWKFINQYVPEIVARDHLDPAPLGTSEFDGLIASLPLKAEVADVTFRTHELQQIGVGALDRTTYDEAVAAHRRRLRGPASKLGGEFFCTLSRALRWFPKTARLADRLFTIGVDLQFRHRVRKSI